MLQLKFSYETSIRFSKEVTDHAILLRCFPQNIQGQKVEQCIHTNTPLVTGGQYSTDGFGNTVYTGRIDRGHDHFDYRVTGVVTRNDEERVFEEALPCYRYPSPLTQGNDFMAHCLEGLSLQGTTFEKARQIADYVHSFLSYEPGSTTVNTTAAQAFEMGKGVCQDFAHVCITLCRMAGIAARYVCGLTRGEGETHAWVEVWQDGYWKGLDPTRGCEADEGYIKLCVGRDYNDSPTLRGVFCGDALQDQSIYMKVTSA